MRNRPALALMQKFLSRILMQRIIRCSFAPTTAAYLLSRSCISADAAVAGDVLLASGAAPDALHACRQSLCTLI